MYQIWPKMHLMIELYFLLQIAECFRPLRELVDEPPFKEYIPPAWAAIVKIKDAHYKAIAHYYAAVIHDKMYEVCSSKETQRNTIMSIKLYNYYNI